MSKEGWQKRQLIWRHNAFIGSAVMMRKQCVAILNSSTATPEARVIAVRIENDAFELERELRKGRANAS